MAQPAVLVLDALSSAVQAFRQSIHSHRQDAVLGYLEASAAIHRLLAAIRSAELGGVPAEGIQRLLGPAREFPGDSPLVRRMQTWPRGYPGDFETIEQLCEGGALAGAMHPLDQCCVSVPVAQQHRNKIAWQGQQLLAAVLARPGARLLSVACGGSRDLAAIAPLLRGRDFHLVLNDADRDALALSARRAEEAGGTLTLLPGDVFRVVRRLEGTPPFDAIVVGGLFDYLDVRRATWLLTRLRALRAPGGALCFTNLAPGSPYAGWLTHLVGWPLVYRDEAEVRRLLRAAGEAPGDETTTARDTTGHALLVRHVRRDGA